MALEIKNQPQLLALKSQTDGSVHHILLSPEKSSIPGAAIRNTEDTSVLDFCILVIIAAVECKNLEKTRLTSENIHAALLKAWEDTIAGNPTKNNPMPFTATIEMHAEDFDAQVKNLLKLEMAVRVLEQAKKIASTKPKHAATIDTVYKPKPHKLMVREEGEGDAHDFRPATYGKYHPVLGSDEPPDLTIREFVIDGATFARRVKESIAVQLAKNEEFTDAQNEMQDAVKTILAKFINDQNFTGDRGVGSERVPAQKQLHDCIDKLRQQIEDLKQSHPKLVNLFILNQNQRISYTSGPLTCAPQKQSQAASSCDMPKTITFAGATIVSITIGVHYLACISMSMHAGRNGKILMSMGIIGTALMFAAGLVLIYNQVQKTPCFARFFSGSQRQESIAPTFPNNSPTLYTTKN